MASLAMVQAIWFDQQNGVQTGSIVLGATVPVLLNSRADGAAQRVLGLIMAQAIRAGQGL